jgi:hypothetical protein
MKAAVKDHLKNAGHRTGEGVDFEDQCEHLPAYERT